MSDSDKFKPQIGAIEWYDLTVKNADEVKDFYSAVIGWQSSPVEMSDGDGNYQDFNIIFPDTKETITGICHARGGNSNIPAQWLMYVRVKDVAESVQTCIQKGGLVLEGPNTMGDSLFCIIQDPEGAILALISGS